MEFQTALETLMFSTIRLVGTTPDSKIVGGTAFFFGVQMSDRRHLTLLMTNNHVISEMNNAHVGVHLRRKDQGIGDYVGAQTIVVPGSLQRYFAPHPDGSTDLCAAEPEFLRQFLPSVDLELQCRFFPDDDVPVDAQWKSMDLMEKVVTIGYPQGFQDNRNNFPIFRSAYTATHPAVDFEGQPHFLIDGTCLPGCSGSPVFSYDQSVGPQLPSGKRKGSVKHFLGILTQTQMHMTTANLKGWPFAEPEPEITVQGLMNLGVVIKASKVLELAEHCRDLWEAKYVI